MKSIMFNEKYGMETATLNGSKTRTTRKFGLKLCKFDDLEGLEIEDAKIENGIIYFSFLNKWYKAPHENQPKYNVGEVVAIKQAYKDINIDFIPCNGKGKWGNPKGMAGWTNKMFVRADLMPHQIQITDIKLERLQDISNEDCINEGLKVRMVNMGFGSYARQECYCFDWEDSLGRSYDYSHVDPKIVFADLIDMISGKGTWENNDWHIVYYYKLVK